MLSITATQLERYMNCSGSLDLTPFESSEKDMTVRNEGVAVHWMIEDAFKSLRSLEEYTDRKAPNGVYITAAMAEHAEEYFKYVKSIGAQLEADTTHYTDAWQVNGRADAAAALQHSLKVADFKYGWTQVEVKNNWTLISHACALAKKNPNATEIILTIFQPRGFHHDGTVREWKLTIAELIDLYNKIDARLRNPVKTLSTGNHCKDCPAFANCPAAQKAAMRAVDISEHAVFDSKINPANLSVMLDNLYRAEEHLKQTVKAYDELATHQMKQGIIIPEYSLKRGLSNRNWKEGVSVEMISGLFGVDVSKQEIITPAQAEKRGVPKEALESFCERKETGLKIVRISAEKQAKETFNV